MDGGFRPSKMEFGAMHLAAVVSGWWKAVAGAVVSPALVCAALAVAPTPLSAQAANPGFDPRQPEKHFYAVQSEQQRDRTPPSLPKPAGAAPTSADVKPLFVLRGVSISGARAIAPSAMVASYRPFLGRKVSPADLAAIAESITQLYRTAGYHLSRAIVPPQDIRSGRIQIKVIEGSIDAVVLKGDDAEKFGVRPMIEVVMSARPSRQDLLERQLLLVNGRPGVRVADTALEEIGTATGKFRLVVFLKTWHAYTAFGIDNLGSASVGPWQTYATGAFNSYLAPGDSLVLNLSTIPTDPRQLGFGRLSYDVPVGTDGVRIGGSALYSEVRPGDWRRRYDDITKTEAFEVRASVVPLQSQNSTLTLTTAATLSNISESDRFGALYNDRLRIVSLTSDLRLKDDFGGVNYLTMTWRQGLDIFGASRYGDDFLSRNNGSGAFSALNVWFTRYQTLNESWSLKVAAAGQYASTALLTSQQFYLGGAAFGRGYGNAEISGDNGMAGSLELRFDQPLSLPYTTGYQLYGFVETGAAWNVGHSFTDGLSLASAGAGLRVFFEGDLRADVGVAFPLSYRAPDNDTRSARLLFTLSNSFRLCPERTLFCCS
jgi:hemolysin activation/secretion protein